MILAIDVGNTHIEVGLYREREYLTSWRITTGVNRTEDELMSFLHQFLVIKNYPVSEVKAIAIASVVPRINQILEKLCEKYFQIEPLFIDHTLNIGITIDYSPPASVGADRICNAIAAYEKYGGPNIIVDFGTATTLDVVDKAGVYLGGIIAPGLETTAWGLHERASKLPQISLEFPGRSIGKSTEESMQSGIMLGTVKMIDGLIELVQEELQARANIIATGGLAKIISPRSKYIQYIEPTLVLDGIVNIYFKNAT